MQHIDFRSSLPPLSLAGDLYSRRGSWLALDLLDPYRLILHLSHLPQGRPPVAAIKFVDQGQPVLTQQVLTPGHLELVSANGSGGAVVTLFNETDLLIESRSLGIQVDPSIASGHTYQLSTDDHRVWTTTCQGWTLHLVIVEGRNPVIDNEIWSVAPVGDSCRLVIRLFRDSPTPLPVDLTDIAAPAVDDWNRFVDKLPPVHSDQIPTAAHAWYNLWYSTGAIAPPNFPRAPILMSKIKMNALWAWDHCFVALALGITDLEAALDQFLLPFDLQRENGVLPDKTGPEDISWLGTKPPIHGWALGKLMDRHHIPSETLSAIYPKLVKWTEFWFTERDANGNGIPGYITSTPGPGWDSGWDNSTVAGGPGETEAPELQAYLILQMNTLARIATQLELEADANAWTRRANDHLLVFRANFYVDNRVATRLHDGQKVVTHYTSLEPFLSLVLGEHLDPDIFVSLAEGLNDYLTPFGLATEKIDSPDYMADGYWRGPIWAPAMYLIIDGLNRGGRRDIALDMAARYDRLIATAGGYYENFDALTGAGLCAKSYTWTSAVHILLLNEYR